MKARPACFIRKCSLLLKELLSISIIVFSLILLPVNTHGADVRLAWDPNSEEDLAGYILYYGTGSREYTQRIDVGNVTEFTISGIDEYTTYFFAATAYDVDGNESGYSEELIYTIAANPPTDNTPPVADAGPDQIVALKDTILLDGSKSYDADGDIIFYSWSIISAPSGSKAKLLQNNNAISTLVTDLPGTYLAQLVVNDGRVNSSNDTVSIAVDDTNSAIQKDDQYASTYDGSSDNSNGGCFINSIFTF